jgi:hypothetical protein
MKGGEGGREGGRKDGEKKTKKHENICQKSTYFSMK